MINLIGNTLKKLRTEKGNTQQEIAEYLGIARGTYAHYEINKRRPDYEIIQKLADYFNVSVDYLLGRETPQATSSPDEPSPQELEEILRNSNVQFNGAPLDEEDKEEILDFITFAWNKFKKKDS